MYNETNENDLKIQLNYADNNSLDSEDDDFQTSGKFLTFNKITNRLGEINSKVNIAKKDTKMSSNTEEDIETENLNNIKDNKNTNNFDINIPNHENNNQKKSRNNNDEDDLNLHITSSATNVANLNIDTLENNNTNYNYRSKKEELSEDKKITNVDVLSLNNKVGSLEVIDKYNHKKLKPISPTKNKKKKKIIVLEEKMKYKTNKKAYLMEEKEEKKDEKNLRKDKNGVPICKKNRRKVKISFGTPFIIETPIESYKKYNILLGMPRDDNFINSKVGNCQCCCLI